MCVNHFLFPFFTYPNISNCRSDSYAVEAESRFLQVIESAASACIDINGSKKIISEILKIFDPLDSQVVFSNRDANQYVTWSMLSLGRLSLVRQLVAQTNDFCQAVSFAEASLSRQPQSSDCQLLLGWALFRTRDFISVPQVLSNAIASNDRAKAKRAHLLASAACERSDLISAALEHVNLALENDSNSFEVLMQASIVYARADSSIKPGSLSSALMFSVKALDVSRLITIDLEEASQTETNTHHRNSLYTH